MAVVLFIVGLILFGLVGGPLGAALWIVLFFIAAYASWVA